MFGGVIAGITVGHWHYLFSISGGVGFCLFLLSITLSLFASATWQAGRIQVATPIFGRI
jgi:hypothetical protein